MDRMLSLDPVFYVGLYVFGAGVLLASIYNVMTAPGDHGLRLHLISAIFVVTAGLALWGGEGAKILLEPSHRLYGGILILFGQIGLLYVLRGIYLGVRERIGEGWH